MPKASYRIVRPSRLEAYQLLQFLARVEVHNVRSFGLLVPRDSDRWRQVEAERLERLDALFALVVGRLERGSTRRKGDKLGNPAALIPIQMPLALVQYGASLIAPTGSGLFGGARRSQRAVDFKPYPGAWLFARKCELAARARRGRPTLNGEAIELRLNNSAAFSERHVFRLLSRSDQLMKTDELLTLLSGSERGA